MTIRLALTVAVLMALSGCGDPRLCGQVDAPGEEVTHGASGFPLVTGDVTLELSPPRFSLCPSGFKYPAVTGVRVLDPANQVVPATFQVVQGRRVQVSFHSDLTGMHHLEVDYTPDPGTERGVTTISSQAFLVPERPLPARLRLGYSCTRLERTARGTWICDYRVLRGATLVQTLRSDMTYEVGGNAVWGVTYDGRSVERWIDSGTGPLTAAGAGTHDPGVAGTGRFSHFVATSDEAALRFDFKLVHLGWTAGTSPSLRVLGSSALLQPAGPGMLWEPPLIAIGFYDGTVEKVCPFTLQAGNLAPAGNCLSPPERRTADGYWTSSTGQLSRSGFKDGALRLLETFPVPISYGSRSPPGLFTSSDDPDRPGWVLLRLRLQPGGAAYEAYAIGPNIFTWVERDYFWWNPESGETEVMVP